VNRFAPGFKTPYRLPTYNGFTHDQRIASIPVQKAAVLTGALAWPTRCSICGFSDRSDPRGRGYIFAHLEDYDRPLRLHPTCKPCHAALHARFREPTRWRSRIECRGHPGSWFHQLTMDPEHQAASYWAIYPGDLPDPD
jgi:hypothetical protein